MRGQPVDLIGGFYKDDALPWSCQDTVNWLPTRAEVSGTRTPWKLETCPGLRESLWLGDATSPIRGMHDLEGQLYFVSGQTLYRVRADGAVDALGLIPGVSRVQMTHNQFSTGYQLLVENGQGGGGYVYTTSTGTFAKITDEGYPGSISSDYLDSYLLGVEPLGRFWFHSNLADATDYNTLDRYEAEAAPDRIVGLAVSQFEVVVFGQRTIEFFLNAGSQTGTFQNRRQSITRGCASRHTIQKLDNTLFWLGDDGIVYRLEGYAARRISTQPLEKAIADYSWSEALAYVWEDRGYKVYYLTFPDGLTFGYDVVTGLWTRRESFSLSRWRPSHMVKCNGKWYAGDFQTGRLWTVDWNYYLEGQVPLVRRHVTGVLDDNQSQLLIPNAELLVATGSIPTTPQAPLSPANQYPSIGAITGSLPSWKHFQDYSADLSYTSTRSLLSVAFSGGDQLPPGAQVTINSGAGKIHIAIPGTETKPKNPLRISIRARDSLGRYILWHGDLAIIGYTWDGTWDTRSIGVGSGNTAGFTLPARNGAAGPYFTRSATDAVAAVSSADTATWATVGASIPAGMTAERGMAYSPTLARLLYAGRYDTYFWTGTAWTALTNGSNKYLEDLQWCPGLSRFIAVGRSDQTGYFYYSTDGAAITGVSVVPGRGYRAAYSPTLNRIVLRDRQGSGKYSDNGGVTWQDCTGSNIPSASTDERVVWCGDRFITAANRSGGANFYESATGIGPWTPVQNSPVQTNSVFVAYSPQINELIASIGTSIYRHVPGSGVFSMSSTRAYAATSMGYVENSRQIFRMIGRATDSNVDITRIG